MPNDPADLPFIAAERERYFEDYLVGAVHLLGEVVVDEDVMLAFARDYDPQDIHIDREKAEAGPFDGLIASGWYTGSLMMRLYARHYLSNVSSLASPGFDDLRWNAPVRAGDVLSVRVSVLEARPSQSKPDRGVVKTFVEIINPADVVVMSLTAVNMIARRPA